MRSGSWLQLSTAGTATPCPELHLLRSRASQASIWRASSPPSPRAAWWRACVERGAATDSPGPPEDYSVGEILRLAEGSLAPVACLDCGSDPCARAGSCRTRPLWERLDALIWWISGPGDPGRSPLRSRLGLLSLLSGRPCSGSTPAAPVLEPRPLFPALRRRA